MKFSEENNLKDDSITQKTKLTVAFKPSYLMDEDSNTINFFNLEDINLNDDEMNAIVNRSKRIVRIKPPCNLIETEDLANIQLCEKKFESYIGFKERGK